MSELGWGLQMTVAGMGTVFLLLIVLMGVLMIIGRIGAPSTKKIEAGSGGSTAALDAGQDTTDVTDDTPGVVQGDSEQEDAEPAPQVRVLADGLTDDQLAAIAVAVLTHRDVRRAQAAPEQRAHQPGSHLYASRWVGIGRGQQTQRWRRK